MKLAANFTTADYFITFTYEPGQEPKSRDEANAHKQKYLRLLRTARKKRGQTLKWAFSIENKHGAGRYHLHAVINAADPKIDFDELKSLWPYGLVDISRLFAGEHEFNTWLDLARYMTKERPEDGEDTTPVGAQIYSCSRNLKLPKIVTEWIEEDAELVAPASALILEREERQNEYSRFKYLKYMTAPICRRE